MREKRTVQSSIFELYVEHEIGRELKAVSDWLDEHPEILDWVEADIQNPTVSEFGRKGLTVESVIRCALLKQYQQLSYEELAFHLMDSMSFQSFARLRTGWVPKKVALQQSISRICEGTWEKINGALLGRACSLGVERGRVVRVDSTVTESMIHAPTDSSLLWDSVRVMVRLCGRAEELAGPGVLDYQNHQRRAKKRMRAIQYTRGRVKKVALYRDLIAVTRRSLGYLEGIERVLLTLPVDPVLHTGWREEVGHFRPLIERVIDQTERRVLRGEKVPAAEKLFSLFEAHTDIIVKGSRDIQYGHKLNLTTGKSGLILDAVIEAGNPADSARFLPMVERHIERYGRAPRQMTADGGYASLENLQGAKDLGVKDVAFHKKRGLKVEDMVKSNWVYRKLRNFRAGIEAGISCLKRVYGLTRCTWKGLTHFKAYVWSSVVTHNLVVLARLQTE